MSFVISISRYLLPIITVMILTKCVLSLLLGHPKEKVYGYIIDLADGESYPLNMWETSIGRSNSCDIVIGYDTVSRYQAVISRRIDGWYIYDLNSKSGIKINGQAFEKKATIKSEDVITFGIMQYRFMVTDDPVVRVGRKKSGRKDSKAGTVPLSAQRPQSRPSESPLFNESDYSDNTYRQSGYDNTAQSYKTQNGAYYDSSWKNFDIDDDNDIYSDKSIYTDRSSFTIETPNKDSYYQNYTYKGSRPKLINRDTGETFILCGNLVSVGRSRTNDIKLSSPSVSRHHADFVLYEDGWAIVDADSTMGTTLNGSLITEPQLLFDGDVIGLSDERLYFERR